MHIAKLLPNLEQFWSFKYRKHVDFVFFKIAVASVPFMLNLRCGSVLSNLCHVSHWYLSSRSCQENMHAADIMTVKLNQTYVEVCVCGSAGRGAEGTAPCIVELGVTFLGTLRGADRFLTFNFVLETPLHPTPQYTHTHTYTNVWHVSLIRSQSFQIHGQAGRRSSRLDELKLQVFGQEKDRSFPESHILMRPCQRQSPDGFTQATGNPSSGNILLL